MALKKKSVFWKIYFAVGGGLILILCAWLVFLFLWLSSYEEVQPKYVAKEVFEKEYVSFDAEKYVKQCKIDTNLFITTDEIIRLLEDAVDGKDIYYKKISTGMDDRLKYVICAGDDSAKFASFYLRQHNVGAGLFKMKKYVVDKESFELNIGFLTKDLETESVVCSVPKGHTVSINGTLLSDKYVTKSDIPTDSCDHMPEGVSGLYYQEYTVNNVIDKPVIEVKNALGKTVDYEIIDGVYTVKPEYDSALKVQHSQWILEGAELYAKYTQYDSRVSNISFNQVAPYFDPSSELYEFIKTVDNDFVIEYDSFEYSDMTADEFIKYDNNTFSCRVSYVQKLINGNDVYTDHVDQTLYLRRVDDKFLIYDMSVN